MINLPSTTVSFDGCDLTVTDINGGRWLFPNQIGSALGLAHADVAVRKIYRRHRQEFSSDMTAVIEVPTSRGPRLTRLFSPRGASLIAMHARTERAMAFRSWVLDVLEGKHPVVPPALPAPITAPSSVEALLAPQAKAALRYARLGLGRSEIGRLLGLKSTSTGKLLRRLRDAQLLPAGGASRHG